MTERRKKYLKDYLKKNYASLRKYRTEWMRLRRSGLRTRGRILTGKTRKLAEDNDDWILTMKGHCKKCGILLSSRYAGKHDGKYCEDCLHKKK